MAADGRFRRSLKAEGLGDDPFGVSRHPANRRRSSLEDGFSLVELLMVMVVIAVLMAIAVPSFLGARGKGQDVAAQSALKTASTAAKLALVGGTYADLTKAGLAQVEPGVAWLDEGVAASAPGEVAWDASPDPSPTNLTLVVRSASGMAYYWVESTVALTGTTGGTTAFVVTGRFPVGNGVEATPANALKSVRGETLTPSATSTTTSTTAAPASTTTSTTRPPTTTTTRPPTTTTTVKPTTTTTVKPPTTTTTLKCTGKKVFDPVTGTCK